MSKFGSMPPDPQIGQNYLRPVVGIARPRGDVHHMVPKSGAAKVLIIWAPAGELRRDFAHAHDAPIPQLEPAKATVLASH